MASPQLENGYTKISNEIMEALGRFRIPGEARQMLDVIIRKTYGFNKTQDQISTTQFMQATGLKRFIIHRARKRLLLSNLITVSKNDNSQILSYSFQKDYEKWILLSKMLTVSKKVLNCMQKSAQTVTIIDDHKRKKETITKEIGPNPDLYPFLKNKDFESLWISWLEVRKHKKIPNTLRAQELALSKLHAWGESKAREALKQAIEKGWRGIFEPKDYREPPKPDTTIKEWQKEERVAPEKVSALLQETVRKIGGK